MTKIKITTTQNIDIEYELATLFDRMLAWVIDFVIIVGYVLVAWMVVSIISRDSFTSAHTLVVVPAFFYHLLSEWLLHGRSVGKLATRTRVVRLDGSPPNAGNYLMRWMFRLLETNPILLYGLPSVVSIAFSEKGQRVGDILSSTTVIKLERQTSMADTIYLRAREDYTPVFPETAKLSDTDVTTIRDVLGDFRREGDKKVLNACANRVAHVLHVTPPEQMNAEQFLRTILRDYSHLS